MLNLKGLGKEQKSHLMRASIEQLAKDILSPGNGDKVIAEFLRLDRLFWRYSFGNTALIAMQAPASRRVASLRRFDKLAKEQGHKAEKWGREKYPQAVSPRAGTHAIWIWVPKQFKKTVEGEDGPEEVKGTFFGPGQVWAVEELAFRDTGKPCHEDPNFLPDFIPNHGEQVGPYHEALRLWAEGEGIAVEQGFTGDAAGISYGGRIVERVGTPVGKRFATLVHEVGHELLHYKEDRPEERRVREVEAEAVAMCVCEYFGLSQAEHSAAYLRNHGATPKDVIDSLSRIFNTAKRIVDAIEKGTEEEEVDPLVEPLAVAVGE